MIHILVYWKRNPWYSLLTLQDLVTLGLLTDDEIQALEPTDNKMTEALVSWVVRECYDGREMGLLGCGPRFLDPTAIRSEISAFNNGFSVGQPNLWAALMKFVCDLLVVLFVIGSSFESFLYQLGPFQYYSVIFSVFLSVPWLCAQVWTDRQTDRQTDR